MTALTLGLAAAGLTAVTVICFVQPLEKSSLGALGGGAFIIFLIGTFVSQWVANWLAAQRPRR
jgi:hypothetical protein